MPAPKGARGFDFYSAKDRVMADAAEHGLMLWDGKSQGHDQQRREPVRDGKPVVVYVAPHRRFLTVKTFDDLRGVLAQGETESVERVVSALHLEDLQHRIAD